MSMFDEVMSTSSSIHNPGKKLKVHKLLSLLIMAIGFLLMIYMITVESEPGASPSLLVVVGIGWFLFTLGRIRSHQRKAQ
jgi:hypothetical protein